QSNGTVTPISNGSIKPGNGFDLTHHDAFTTIDGQHVIVYQCLNNNPNIAPFGTNFSDFSLFYNYNAPRYLMYAQLIKKDDQSEEFLLYISYDVAITSDGPGEITCKPWFHSLNFQSNICSYIESAEYQTSKYTKFMKFIKFSSSGSVIGVDTLNVSDELSYRQKMQKNLTIPLPYGGAIVFYTDSSPSKPLPNMPNNTFKVLTFDLDTMVNGYLLYNNTSNTLRLDLGDYGVFSDNTIWFIQKNSAYKALLRLNHDGASYFSSNQSQLLDDLLQQIKDCIPLMNDQLKITHNVQSDPSDPFMLLIEFSIDKAADPRVVDDLDIIIKSKYISALSDKPFMTFIDEQYGFQ
ncbi:15657_t:CDS:2, partial [Racocetra fulgida]